MAAGPGDAAGGGGPVTGGELGADRLDLALPASLGQADQAAGQIDSHAPRNPGGLSRLRARRARVSLPPAEARTGVDPVAGLLDRRPTSVPAPDIEIDDFDLRGPQAVALLAGSADIARETQSVQGVAVPGLQTASASLACAAVNPAIALGAFVGQWLLREPLGQASAREFRICAGWDNPKVARVERKLRAPLPDNVAAAPIRPITPPMPMTPPMPITPIKPTQP